jgi:drug/metabolite transporter (DMT)-like permease
MSTDNKLHAIGLVMLAVMMASTQDMIVKSVSGVYPAYEMVVFRCVVSVPILGVWLAMKGGLPTLATPYLPRILLRSFVLCSAYFAYILSLSSLAMANTVSIYFTLPLFVAALSGWGLGEKVPLHRWIAIIAGFVGVLVMVRPATGSFQPASLLALYSAFAYAVGQMMGRSLSQRVDTLVISNWQNMIYLIVAIVMGLVVYIFGLANEGSKTLAFLTRPPSWPEPSHYAVLLSMGFLAAVAMMAYVNAYRSAPANFVAPFEYSAMIWAVLYGALFFHDFPDFWTMVGAAIVVSAGLFMLWRDHVMGRQTTG